MNRAIDKFVHIFTHFFFFCIHSFTQSLYLIYSFSQSVILLFYISHYLVLRDLPNRTVLFNFCKTDLACTCIHMPSNLKLRSGSGFQQVSINSGNFMNFCEVCDACHVDSDRVDIWDGDIMSEWNYHTCIEVSILLFNICLVLHFLSSS